MVVVAVDVTASGVEGLDGGLAVDVVVAGSVVVVELVELVEVDVAIADVELEVEVDVGGAAQGPVAGRWAKTELDSAEKTSTVVA